MAQGELFKAETTWFHVFKSMIDSGDLAKMSGSTIKVYFVVKSYTNFATGRAFPGHSTVAKDAGVSVATVKRCLDELETFGYVSKSLSGRNNVYMLREKVQCQGMNGRPSAEATWDYLPSTVREAQAELKNFCLRGKEGSIVNIKHLTLNMFSDHAKQINLGLDDLPVGLRKQIESMIASAKSNKSNK